MTAKKKVTKKKVTKLVPATVSQAKYDELLAKKDAVLAEHHTFVKSVKEHYLTLARLLKHASESVDRTINTLENPLNKQDY